MTPAPRSPAGNRRSLRDASADGAAAVLVPPGSRGSTGVIHAHLRSRILSGEFAAGSELSQARVAKECGVSRGPVREAFRLLEREGLIEAEVNHRARVTGLSIADVEHVYALRVVNEALALPVSVPRFTAEELQEMEDLVAAVGRSQGFGAWEEQHQRFHMLLLTHAGERMLLSVKQWAEHRSVIAVSTCTTREAAGRTGAREHGEWPASAVSATPQGPPACWAGTCPGPR